MAAPAGPNPKPPGAAPTADALYLSVVAISPDAPFLTRLTDRMVEAQLALRTYDTAAAFREWFRHGAFARAYREADPRNVEDSIEVLGRPDLVLIDLDPRFGNADDRLALIAEMLGDPNRTSADEPLHSGDPTAEIVAVHPALDATQIEVLVRRGCGTVLAKPNSIGEHERLRDHALRVAEFSRRRLVQRRFARIGRERTPPPNEEGKRVFISHQNGDRHVSFGVRRYLEAKGLRTWYSFVDSPLSQTWKDRTQSALNESAVFLPLVSARWRASKACWWEAQNFPHRKEPQRIEALVIDGTFDLTDPRADEFVREFGRPLGVTSPLGPQLEAAVERIRRLLPRP